MGVIFFQSQKCTLLAAEPNLHLKPITKIYHFKKCRYQNDEGLTEKCYTTHPVVRFIHVINFINLPLFPSHSYWIDCFIASLKLTIIISVLCWNNSDFQKMRGSSDTVPSSNVMTPLSKPSFLTADLKSEKAQCYICE